MSGGVRADTTSDGSSGAKRSTDGGSDVSSPIARDLDLMLAALDARRPAVAAHSRRVSAYAVLLARQYGLPDDMIEVIRVGGLLHDIGKLKVSARVLAKPSRLTEEEWRSLQSHPELGYDMVVHQHVDPVVAEIILHHHERMDGSGYPDGLFGEEIPWPVRIISVMDAFDAITGPRAYRKSLSLDGARTLLAREAATHYCPWAVSGLLSLPIAMLETIALGETRSSRPDARPSEDILGTLTDPWTTSLLAPEQAAAFA